MTLPICVFRQITVLKRLTVDRLKKSRDNAIKCSSSSLIFLFSIVICGFVQLKFMVLCDCCHCHSKHSFISGFFIVLPRVDRENGGSRTKMHYFVYTELNGCRFFSRLRKSMCTHTETSKPSHQIYIEITPSFSLFQNHYYDLTRHK